MVQRLATCPTTANLSRMSAAVCSIHLMSPRVCHCVVPRTPTGFGDRAFQVAGPKVWNSLPALLRQSDITILQFKKLLKTHLFADTAAH